MQFFLPTQKGIEDIRTDDIVRIKAVSNYSKLYFANGKTLVVAKVLRRFEESLPAAQFVRCHRGHLVNKDFVLRYTACGRVELRNGEFVAVSRRKKKTIGAAYSINEAGRLLPNL